MDSLADGEIEKKGSVVLYCLDVFFADSPVTLSVILDALAL
jgi:hypothetical protein